MTLPKFKTNVLYYVAFLTRKSLGCQRVVEKPKGAWNLLPPSGVCAFITKAYERGFAMKGILLWLVGLPIPIIILLYLFGIL
jgi:hypothetical protein